MNVSESVAGLSTLTNWHCSLSWTYWILFYTHLLLHSPIAHSYFPSVCRTCFTLRHRAHVRFDSVCAIATRYYDERPEMYPIAMHFAKHAAANALISGDLRRLLSGRLCTDFIHTGRKCLELSLAYMLLVYYAEPGKRWQESRVWLYTGLAIRSGDFLTFLPQVLISRRVATDLDLQKFATDEPTSEWDERQRLSRVRVWLNCYTLDRSVSTLWGRPGITKED